VLGLATGVSISPGGDSGPASFIPQIWGLQEMDAYLLVVDGVPWGGTFNPATSDLNLSDLDRVEVLRGPAPVMYGATSFAGVIQVVHKDSAAQQRTLNIWGGSYTSGGASFSSPIQMGQNWNSRITLEGQNQGYSNQRTLYSRGHALWNLDHKTSAANYEFFNFDVNWLNQDPYTPRPRTGTTLDPNVLPDSNQNMGGAYLNDRRFSFYGGFNREVGDGNEWSTTVSYAPTRQNILHGFLLVPENVEDNARGIQENIQQYELYADTHLSFKPSRPIRFIVGADYNYGLAHAQGADFEYTAPLSGIPAPSVALPEDLDFHINDTRNFVGVYGSTEWTPLERLRFDIGIRLNVTNENQQVIDGGAGTQDQETQNNVQPGANAGVMFTAWQNGQSSIGLYANYRYTFKPAAIDFGIGEEEEGGGGGLILLPETSSSYEAGLKGQFLNGRLQLEASGFYMDFANLVTAANINGLPTLINSGTERFTGFETGGTLALPKSFMLRGTYSYHKANFVNFAQDFDGVLTSLNGKRIEMSPNNIGGAGIIYSPPKGFFGNVQVIYTGSRYLNKRNTALAGGFTTVEAGVGYRFGRWEFVVNGRNLTDKRDPVTESELGDAQYYLLPARRVDAGLRVNF
jgi:iron complex outermembrane receptor protein